MTSPKELLSLAEKATGDGKQAGDWYVVDSPWLPPGAETYIVAGSPDPHAGLYVCDFVSADIAGVESDWTEDEWSARNWAIAAFIAAANPSTIKSLILALEEKTEECQLRRDALDAATIRAEQAEAALAVLAGAINDLIRNGLETKGWPPVLRIIEDKNGDDPHMRLCNLWDNGKWGSLPTHTTAHLERVRTLEATVEELRDELRTLRDKAHRQGVEDGNLIGRIKANQRTPGTMEVCLICEQKFTPGTCRYSSDTVAFKRNYPDNCPIRQKKEAT